MTAKSLFFLLFLLLAGACKKESPKPVNEPLAPAQQPTGDSSSYDALFASTRVYSKLNGQYGNQASGSSFGYYSSQLITKEVYSSADLTNIGTVSLNGVIFKNKSVLSNFYYNDTSYSVFPQPQQWKILGSSVVDSFSYVNTNPFPSFEGATLLPDTLKLSQGLNLALKKVKDCSLIKVSIFGGASSTSFPYKLIAGTDSLVNFSPAELEGLASTSGGALNVFFYKDNYRNINGKRVNFRTGTSYLNNYFTIKP